MQFTFTEEQLMIRDTAAAFLADVSGGESVRRAMATEQGYEDAVWQRLCTEMYWQACHIPEAYGGMGLGQVELIAIQEQIGRHLLCAPFFSSACLATNAICLAGSEQQKERYLPQLAEGLTATLAYIGDSRQCSSAAVTAVYEKSAAGYRINGRASYVIDGHTAQLIVVAARAANSIGQQGISLFILPADHPGLERRWLPTMDQTRKQAELRFNNLSLPQDSLLGEEAGADLDRLIDLASIALAAEQMGAAQQLLDMTVEYAKERQQFNRPIASFQAIKHKAADMMLRVEAARSAVYYAACIAQEAVGGGPLSAQLGEAAAIAKASCNEACFSNAAEALQIHGGVGFTWEYDVHLFLKRAKASEQMLGSSAYHYERIAGLLLDQGDER